MILPPAAGRKFGRARDLPAIRSALQNLTSAGLPTKFGKGWSGGGQMPIALPELDSPSPTLCYVQEYLSPLEEDQLLREIHSSRGRWKEVSGRRLQVGRRALPTQCLPCWTGRHHPARPPC